MRKASPNLGNKLYDECAQRFQRWIKTNTPSGARKQIAKAIGTTPYTVDHWLKSETPYLPGTKHLLAALAAFGPHFAAQVLGPCGDWARSISFEARAEKLRNEIEALQRDLEEMSKISKAMDVVRDIEMVLHEGRLAIAKSKEAADRASEA